MNYILTLLSLLFLSYNLYSEVIRYDNGTPFASYSGGVFHNWEESAIFDPDGSCFVKSIGIYFSGDFASKDTIWLCGSPFDYPYASSGFAWDMAKISEPILFDYPGEPGWYEFDLSENPIYIGEINYLVIQHKIKLNGPNFVYDSDENNNKMSLLCNAPAPNPNFFNIRGTLYYSTDGDYLVWIDVEYETLPSEINTEPYPPSFFSDVSESSGMLKESNNNLRYIDVSVADWNSDGFDDVSFGRVHFQNNGDGTFTNVNHIINIRAQGTSWADYNNDGLLDCFAIKNAEFGVDQLFWQTVDGDFVDQTSADFMIEDPSVTPLWNDYNNDGYLDLFIAYGRKTINGNEVYYPDQLYKNKGSGKFDLITETAGISNGEPYPYYDCWSASLCDYNNDNLTDIFVATYRLAPDRLYKNNGDGTYTEVSEQTGVLGIPTMDPRYFGHGMGSDWGDFNNDGYVDLAVGNLAHPDSRGKVSNPSLLFQNNGGDNFTFTDVHYEKRLNYYEMNSGILWLDINQDSYLDLCHCNYSYNLRNESVDRFTRFYINQGPDANYMLKDITKLLGIDVHGAWSPVRLDYDWDGDMDIIIASQMDQAKLYRNDYPFKGNWITFRLKGDPESGVNSQGYGSTLILYTPDHQYRRFLPGTIISARSSQSTDELHFGLNNAEIIERVEVTFSDGNTFVYDNLDINRKYILHYGGIAEPMKLTAPQMLIPIDNSIQCIGNPKITWLKSGGATSYHIQIAGDDEFQNMIFNKIDIKGANYQPDGLNINNWYYWRVKAKSENDESPWSSVWRFRVDKPAGIENQNTFANIKTYPNPVDNASNIEFDLKSYDFVSLNLFDSNGLLISKLIEYELMPGRYTFTLETASLSSGSYYYILKVGENNYTEKIVVIK